MRAISGIILSIIATVAYLLFAKHTSPDVYLPKGVPSSSESPLTIIFTGDVMLGRSVNTRIIKHNSPNWPFLHTADFLQSADLTVINLESPLIENCPPTDQGMIFCGQTSSVDGLRFAGVDLAGIANNHINNQGFDGIDQTKNALASSGITPLEDQKPITISQKGRNLTFLAISDLPPLDKKVLQDTLSRLPSEHFVIVYMHAGNEYQAQPTTRQQEIARLSIDHGADLIVGHHPHQTQTHEVYKNKHIFYSLGNFIFDQMWSSETTKGHLLKISIEKEQVNYSLFPVSIKDFGQPIITSSEPLLENTQ